MLENKGKDRRMGEKKIIERSGKKRGILSTQGHQKRIFRKILGEKVVKGGLYRG